MKEEMLMKRASTALIAVLLCLCAGLSVVSLGVLTKDAHADGSKDSKVILGDKAQFQIELGKSETETLVDGFSVSRVALFPLDDDLTLKLSDFRNQSHDVTIKQKRWMIVAAHKIEAQGGEKGNKIRVVSLN